MSDPSDFEPPEDVDEKAKALIATSLIRLGGFVKIRREGKMSQAELASAVGISTSILSKIENGKQAPLFANLVRISQILEIDLSLLFLEKLPDGAITNPRTSQIISLCEEFEEEDFEFFVQIAKILQERALKRKRNAGTE